MTGIFHLTWRYLAYHKLKTLVLVGVVATIVYLPAALDIVVRHSARELTIRSQTTPLLIGAKGSPLELVLNALYFESRPPPAIPYAEVDRVRDSELARAIPLHTRFRAGNSPVVGTTLDYLEFRGLELAEGRLMAMLGECVLGAAAAQSADARPGDDVLSSSENVFDLVGVYPLKMKVVGVLRPAGTPDDLAVFADLKTAWVIEGLAHGHEDLRQPAAAEGVLRTEGRKIVANASVVEYNEITRDNMASFHFHGDPADFPVTSIIAWPHDTRSETLLQGRYLRDQEAVQVVRPAAVMDDLLGTILTVRRYVLLAAVILGSATLATITLVFVLSFQLRRREMQTLVKIGGSKRLIGSLVAVEILGVLVAGGLLAAALSAATAWLAAAIMRTLVLLA